MNREQANQLERELRLAEQDLVVAKKYLTGKQYEFYANRVEKLRKRYYKEVLGYEEER